MYWFTIKEVCSYNQRSLASVKLSSSSLLESDSLFFFKIDLIS